MKKWIAGFTGVAALMLSSGALAQGYISGAVGQGHQEVECTGIAVCDNTGNAFRIIGGQGFGNGLSLEIGYIDFGKAGATAGFNSGEIKTSAFTVGGAYQLPFTPAFSGNLRLGVASIKAKATFRVGGFTSSASETNAKPYYGLGLSYAFSKAVALELNADFSQAELDGEKADVRAVTAGVRFTF